MNKSQPFFQNNIVFTLSSMGLVGGLIGLIIGVANGSGFLGLLIGILVVVFISIAAISTGQNENKVRYIMCAFFLSWYYRDYTRPLIRLVFGLVLVLALPRKV
jgi:putative spermidine/putrescine transport system permease protein